MIFDNLRDGPFKSDFIACSQVSKTWRAFALEPLFRELNLSFYGEQTQTEDSTASSTGVVTRPKRPTLAIFLDFLTSSPYIAEAVRTLTLICPDDETEEEYDIPRSRVHPRMLIAVLRELPRLRIVKLCDVELAGPSHEIAEIARDPLYPPLTLEELHLVFYDHSGEPQFPMPLNVVMSGLYLFGNVKSLHLRGITLQHRAAKLAEDLPRLYPRQLVLEDLQSFALLMGALLRTDMLHSMEALDADYLCEGDLQHVQSLMEVVGRNLVHFSCAFACEQLHHHRKSLFVRTSILCLIGLAVEIEVDAPLFHALDLSSCHNLSSLDFRILLFRNPFDGDNSRQWTCATHMLSFLGPNSSAPPLKVTFDIDSGPVGGGIVAEHLQNLWNDIIAAEDELVRLVEAKRITQVKVSLRRWNAEIHRDYSPHIFPRLHALGVLLP